MQAGKTSQFSFLVVVKETRSPLFHRNSLPFLFPIASRMPPTLLPMQPRAQARFSVSALASPRGERSKPPTRAPTIPSAASAAASAAAASSSSSSASSTLPAPPAIDQWHDLGGAAAASGEKDANYCGVEGESRTKGENGSGEIEKRHPTTMAALSTSTSTSTTNGKKKKKQEPRSPGATPCPPPLPRPTLPLRASTTSTPSAAR